MKQDRMFPTYRKGRVLSGVQTKYRAWKDWDKDDTIICVLRGTSPNRKNKSKVDWIVEVVDAFFVDKKAQKLLIGETVTLNCAGQLDKGMSQIEIGDEVQITYNGSREMQGGEYEGQMAHTMEVVAVENSAAPVKPAKAIAAKKGRGYTDGEASEEDDEDL